MMLTKRQYELWLKTQEVTAWLILLAGAVGCVALYVRIFGV